MDDPRDKVAVVNGRKAGKTAILLAAGTMYPSSVLLHASKLVRQDLCAQGVDSEPLSGDEFNSVLRAEPSIPRRLHIVPGKPDYHPRYMRVGIRFNGEERNDVMRYDLDEGIIETVNRHIERGEIEPYWRYPETRQQRRARERWERKR